MGTEGNAIHKFQENCNFTFERLFEFTFSGCSTWNALAKELGEEKFYKALKKIVDEAGAEGGKELAVKSTDNDFASFVTAIKKPKHFIHHVTTLEVVEDVPDAFEVRITECLWAQTFRKMGLEKLGYQLFCDQDYAECKGFNPKISLVRTKTLMQGDDCCNHRYILEK